MKDRLLFSHAEIEDILEEKDFHIELVVRRIMDTSGVHEDDIIELSREFEECADVMQGLPTYDRLAQSMYRLVSFMRGNSSVISQRQGPFLNFLNSFVPTLKQFRVVLFDYDIENKEGFYASFENDCKMLESFVSNDFGNEQGDCTLF